MTRRNRMIPIFALFFLLPMCANPAAQKWKDLSSQYQTTLEQSRKDYAKTYELLEIAKQAVQWAELHFGPRDPRRARSLLFLAEASLHTSDFAQAETLYKQALDLYDQIRKRNTLDYARGLKDLGLLQSVQNRTDEAFASLQEAREIIEKLPNPLVKELADIHYFLALVCEEQKKDFSVSETHYKRSLEIKKKILGEIHEDVADDLSRLAAQYRIRKRFDEAEPLYREALAIHEKLYGPEDDRVAGFLERTGTYYYEQKVYDRAEPYFDRAMVLWEKIHGAESVKLAPFLIRRGNYYNDWDRPERAEYFFKKELSVKEKAFGPDGAELDWSLERLFKFYEARKNIAAAEPYFDRWVRLREKTLQPDNSYYFEELRDYAEHYVRWARWTKAEELYRRLLSAFAGFPDKNWEFEAWAAERLLHLCVIQYKYDEAREFGRQALAAWEKAGAPDKIEFAEFLESLAVYNRGDNKIKEAEALEQRAREIRARLPKSEPPETDKPE